MALIARISQRSRQILEEIMQATGERQIDVIEQALLIYRRHWRLQRLSDDFRRLQSNKEEVASYRKEQEELEGTVGDGLDSDE